MMYVTCCYLPAVAPSLLGYGGGFRVVDINVLCVCIGLDWLFYYTILLLMFA